MKKTDDQFEKKSKTHSTCIKIFCMVCLYTIAHGSAIRWWLLVSNRLTDRYAGGCWCPID